MSMLAVGASLPLLSLPHCVRVAFYRTRVWGLEPP